MARPNISRNDLLNIMNIPENDPHRQQKIQAIYDAANTEFNPPDPTPSLPDAEAHSARSLSNSFRGPSLPDPSGAANASLNSNSQAAMMALQNAARNGAVGNPSQAQMQQGISDAMQNRQPAAPQVNPNDQAVIDQLLQKRGVASGSALSPQDQAKQDIINAAQQNQELQQSDKDLQNSVPQGKPVPGYARGGSINPQQEQMNAMRLKILQEKARQGQ